jgi:hypothetical protein
MSPLMLTLSADVGLRDELHRLWLARFPQGTVSHGYDMADVLLRLAGAHRPGELQLLVLDTASCQPVEGFVHQVRRLAPTLSMLAVAAQAAPQAALQVAGLQLHARHALPSLLQAFPKEAGNH